MEQKILTRKQAATLCKTRYFTGKECARGHLSERYTRTGTCCDCSAKYKRKYIADILGNQHGLKKVLYLVHKDDVPKIDAYVTALCQARTLDGDI